MVELITKINDKKKQFEDSVKSGNPYGAIGTKPGKPGWEPNTNEKSLCDAFGPYDFELQDFELNGEPSEPFENDFSFLPLQSK